MDNDCPYKRNYHSYTVEFMMANKYEIKDKLYYQNSMYNLREFRVIIFDSGCTRHMFAQKCYSTHLRIVRTADGREVPTVGVGNTHLLKKHHVGADTALRIDFQVSAGG